MSTQIEEINKVKKYFAQCDINQIKELLKLGKIELNEHFFVEPSPIVTLTDQILSIAIENKVDRLTIINSDYDRPHINFIKISNNQTKNQTLQDLAPNINIDFATTEAIVNRIQVIAEMNHLQKNKYRQGRLIVAHPQIRKFAYIFTCPTSRQDTQTLNTTSLLLIFLNDQNSDKIQFNTRSSNENDNNNQEEFGLPIDKDELWLQLEVEEESPDPPLLGFSGQEAKELAEIRSYFATCNHNQWENSEPINSINFDIQTEDTPIRILAKKILSNAMDDNIDRLLIIHLPYSDSFIEFTKTQENKTYFPENLQSALNINDGQLTRSIINELQILGGINVINVNKNLYSQSIMTYEGSARTAYMFTSVRKHYIDQSILIVFKAMAK